MTKRSKRTRIELDDKPLQHNPFAQLTPTPDPDAERGSQPDSDAGQGGGQPAPAPTARTAAPAWQVARTRKGGWPVRIERRSAGKTVTLVERVSGDTDVLARELKRLCGVGGRALAEAVEVQGDKADQIGQFLDRQQGRASDV